VTAELWIGSLSSVADREPPGGIVLSRVADEAWLSLYRRERAGLGEIALKVLGSGPSVWFATVPGPAGKPPAAIGRCVVDGRWAGFTAVEVDPAHRRQGLGSAVMTALARQALAEGASACWLQVETNSTAARALYTMTGFMAHHAYHHYRAPGTTGTGAETAARTGRTIAAPSPGTAPGSGGSTITEAGATAARPGEAGDARRATAEENRPSAGEGGVGQVSGSLAESYRSL
jgi:ribosomal protein S18 acetylase RimI-like enzyme